MKRISLLTLLSFAILALALGGLSAFGAGKDVGDQPTEFIKMYENTQVVTRYYEEVLNKGDLSQLEVLFSDGSLEGHQCVAAETEIANNTLYSLRRTLSEVHQAYSNIEVNIDEISAGGDTVTVAWTFNGVFNPTGQAFNYSGMDKWRLEDGKIVGRWGSQDLLGLAKQTLGLGARMHLPQVVSDYRPTDVDRSSVEAYYRHAFQKESDQLSEVFASDFVDHSPDPGQEPGLQGFMRSLRGFQGAFSLPAFTIDEMKVDGDKVRVDWTFVGVLEMTQQRVSFSGTEVWAVKDGKIQERWGEYDLEGLMKAFGVI